MSARIPITFAPIARPNTLTLGNVLVVPPWLGGRGVKGGHRHNLRRAIRATPIGQEVALLAKHNNYAYEAAKAVGAKVRTAKDQFGRGVHVWRVG